LTPTRGAIGGASGALGVTYQDGLAAVIAAAGLAKRAPTPFGLAHEGPFPVTISLQADSAVDDIVVVMSDGSRMFIQAKVNIDLGGGFDSVVRQWVNQLPALGPKDRMILAVSKAAEKVTDLAEALDNRRFAHQMASETPRLADAWEKLDMRLPDTLGALERQRLTQAVYVVSVNAIYERDAEWALAASWLEKAVVAERHGFAALGALARYMNLQSGKRQSSARNEWISAIRRAAIAVTDSEAPVQSMDTRDLDSMGSEVPWTPWPSPAIAAQRSWLSRKILRRVRGSQNEPSRSRLPQGFSRAGDPVIADLGRDPFTSANTRQAAIFEYLPNRCYGARLYLVAPLFPGTNLMGSLDLYRVRCAITHLFSPPPGFAQLDEIETGAYICLVPPFDEMDERRIDVPCFAVPASQLRHAVPWWEPRYAGSHQPPAEGTFTAAETARALGHRLPYWPRGTNTKEMVLSWAPDRKQLTNVVGEDVIGLWHVCKYAARQSLQQPQTGLRELALISYEQLAYYTGQPRSLAGLSERRTTFGPEWHLAVSDVLPNMPHVKSGPAKDFFYDGVQWLLTTDNTPDYVTEAIYQWYGDAYRSEPFVCARTYTPEGIKDLLNRCRPAKPTTGRLRHLLRHAQETHPLEHWRLYENGISEYAVCDSYIAWLAAADKVYADGCHNLLPADSHEAYLMANAAGQLGGWIVSLNGSTVMLPYAGVIDRRRAAPGPLHTDAPTFLAGLVTGNRIWAAADDTHLTGILAQLSHERPTRFNWETITDVVTHILEGA
jgi:hypothetical protein